MFRFNLLTTLRPTPSAQVVPQVSSNFVLSRVLSVQRYRISHDACAGHSLSKRSGKLNINHDKRLLWSNLLTLCRGNEGEIIPTVHLSLPMGPGGGAYVGRPASSSCTLTTLSTREQLSDFPGDHGAETVQRSRTPSTTTHRYHPFQGPQ